MLKSDFPTDSVDILLGAMVPPLADQAKAYGLTLTNAEAWERKHRAWNILRIGGLLTDAESDRIARRMVKEITRDLTYEAALGDLVEEITGGKPTNCEPCPEPEPIAQAAEPGATDEASPPAGELSRYLPDSIVDGRDPATLTP